MWGNAFTLHLRRRNKEKQGHLGPRRTKSAPQLQAPASPRHLLPTGSLLQHRLVQHSIPGSVDPGSKFTTKHQSPQPSKSLRAHLMLGNGKQPSVFLHRSDLLCHPIMPLPLMGMTSFLHHPGHVPGSLFSLSFHGLKIDTRPSLSAICLRLGRIYENTRSCSVTKIITFKVIIFISICNIILGL